MKNVIMKKDELFEKKLGYYGNMRKKVLYLTDRTQYDELVKINELHKHCLYVEKEAAIMHKKVYKEFENKGYSMPQLYDIAENCIKNWIGYYKI